LLNAFIDTYAFQEDIESVQLITYNSLNNSNGSNNETSSTSDFLKPKTNENESSSNEVNYSSQYIMFYDQYKV